MSANEGANSVEAQSSTDANNPEGEQANEQQAAGGGGGGSGGAVAVIENKPPVDDYIRLRVITSDMTNEVHFRVKAATSLGRLKRSYCGRLGFQADELRFVFDGHRITDDDTPKSLNMVNDDVIEIYQERTGGM